MGAQQLAINATTGDLKWKIDAFDVDGMPVTAYGIMTVINAYDNQIYAYGKGPTATTVSAPQIGVTTKTPVTITGIVTDISAGAKQEAVASNYPNGLPAISDASMSQFMESVYMQQPKHTNATGVLVTLSVIDSNGNLRQIGATTSDSDGTYAFTWTPDITGTYAVIANFAGSNSYYGSSAQTHFYASEPATTLQPTTSNPSNIATTTDIMTYMAVGVVVIIIAIAIVGLLIIRKHP